MNLYRISLTILTIALVASPVLAEQVCSVHDGDTIKLCDGRSIRFQGIDAPELIQPMGRESRDFLAAMVLYKDVQLQCSGRSYNRQVCQVSQNGQDIEQAMVRNGWAFDYTHYSHGKYQQDQDFAQGSGAGVWRESNGGQRPWDWRHSK